MKAPVEVCSHESEGRSVQWDCVFLQPQSATQVGTQVSESWAFAAVVLPRAFQGRRPKKLSLHRRVIV